MRIRLTKETETKPGSTSFLRNDGSVTWHKSTAFFAKHDLIHYAVETTLGYQEAFLGLVAGGRGLDSFGTQNGTKDIYTDQEIWTESIAGVCQWSSVVNDSSPNNTELLAILAKTFDERGISAPQISESQLSEIQMRVRDLHSLWDRVPAGETLELEF